MAEPKRIFCAQPNRPDNPDGKFCIGVLAHQISPRMLELKRGEEMQVIVGDQWTAMLPCHKCKRKTSVVCDRGKIDEASLHYAVPKDPDAPPDEPTEDTDKAKADAPATEPAKA